MKTQQHPPLVLSSTNMSKNAITRNDSFLLMPFPFLFHSLWVVEEGRDEIEWRLWWTGGLGVGERDYL